MILQYLKRIREPEKENLALAVFIGDLQTIIVEVVAFYGFICT